MRLPIGEKAPDFSLPGVDGKTYTLQTFADKPVLVLMFTCNHCPYVQAYEDRLIELQREFAGRGVQLAAINANETKNYPEDDFPGMVRRAAMKGYNFPYLRDEDQSVAEAYGAHYTPEIFVLDRERRLRYTGRIDDNWQNPMATKTRDLHSAVGALLDGRAITQPETHAIGCTIKWAKI
jgi:peroxiredoxin